jgi:hypothetical protein
MTAENGNGSENLGFRLESGPILQEHSAPRAAAQLVPALYADRAGWRLRAKNARGQAVNSA